MIHNLTELHSKYQSYKLISNDIENNLLFGLAWDGEGDSKKYYSFKNYMEFENLITHINRVDKNDNFLIKQRIYYEIIGKKCKAFFDIDIKENELTYTKSQFETFIKNIFILYFNKFMRCNICYDDLLIYTRNSDNEFISSIHIIVTNNQLLKYSIINFLDYLKFMSNDPIIDYFDRKIYTRNRLFNLPFNTKLKKFLLDSNNKNNYFLDFKNNKVADSKPKDYLVSCRFGLNQLCSKENTGCLKMVKLHSKNALKNAFEKLKKCERQIYVCCEEQNLDGWDEDGHYCLSCGYKYKPGYFCIFENKKVQDSQNKSVSLKLKPKEQVYFVYPNQTFDFIIQNLPTNFYQSRDWLQVTRLLKKFNITDKQSNTWNEVSVLKANNSKWTIDKNSEFYKNIDVTTIKSGKPIYKSILMKYIPDIEIVFEEKKTQLIEWLQLHTNLSIDIISEQINDKNIKNELYEFKKNETEEFLFNAKNGFLLVRNILTTYTQPISNYYHETDFKRFFEQHKIKNVTEFEKIEDTYILVDNFVNNNEKTLCIKAKWGSGKSHFIIKRMIIKFQNLGNRVIFLTENNALNKQIEKSFKTDTFNIVSHIDVKNLKDITDNIVCSLESIQKINFLETDIIILDEFETICNHFESDTFDNQSLDKFKILKKSLITCQKIVLADADISQPRVCLIEKILNNNQIINTIQANTNNFSDYKFNVFIENESFFEQFSRDLKLEEKICFASSIKSTIDKLYIKIIKDFPQKIVLKIDSDGAKINVNVELNKNNVLKNLEDTLIQNKVDILLFSPTIKTGVSINTDYFDKCFAFGNHSSLCVREFIQMLFRARNLKQKIINIGFGAWTLFKKPQEYITYDRINHVLIHEPTIAYFMLTTDLTNVDTHKQIKDFESMFNFDKEFFTLKTINMFENYNSQKIYTQDFMIRMLYNHNIKVNYIYDLEIVNEEKSEENKEIEEPAELEITKIVAEKLITRSEYVKLVVEDKINLLNYWEKTKAELFYKNFYINGITNQNIYDIDIYDKVNTGWFYQKYLKELTFNYAAINTIINKEFNKIIYLYNDKKPVKEEQLKPIKRQQPIKEEEPIKKEESICKYLYKKEQPVKTIPLVVGLGSKRGNPSEEEQLKPIKEEQLKPIKEEQLKPIKEEQHIKKEQTICHELTFKNFNDSKLGILTITLKFLEIDLLKLPSLMTNSEFKQKLLNNSEYKDLVNYYVDNVIVDLKLHKYKFDTKTDKGFMLFIKEILDYANLEIKYVDTKNTTRISDKLILNYKNFVAKQIFNGRLIETDFRLQEKYITKFKRGFQYRYEDKIFKVYKQVVNCYKIDISNNYYTTYELEINKKTNFLKNRVSAYLITNKDENNKLFCDLLNIEIKPYIFDKFHLYFYKLVQDFSKSNL